MCAVVTDLRVQRADGVLRLTIDRPERRNAMSAAVLTGLRDALSAPTDARVVVVTGAGEQVFCSGADLTTMADDATGLEQHAGRSLLGEVLLAMRACPLPVVARVQGLCLAGGLGLVLGADLALASSAAVFGLPEVGLGLWPFIVSTLLARHVSPKHAMDLMLLADRVDAATAERLGLVSRVLPAETFDADVEALLVRLAGRPPAAVRLGKRAFAAVPDMPLEGGLEAMAAQLSLLATTRDAAEGISAFFERRAPRWTGR